MITLEDGEDLQLETGEVLAAEDSGDEQEPRRDAPRVLARGRRRRR